MHKSKVTLKNQLKWINKPLSYFIAGMFSSLPMAYIMNEKEQNIMKLFFFPLASRAFVDKMLQSGFLPEIKRHGDIVGYVLVASICGVVQILEKYS